MSRSASVAKCGCVRYPPSIRTPPSDPSSLSRPASPLNVSCTYKGPPPTYHPRRSNPFSAAAAVVEIATASANPKPHVLPFISDPPCALSAVAKRVAKRRGAAWVTDLDPEYETLRGFAGCGSPDFSWLSHPWSLQSV